MFVTYITCARARGHHGGFGATRDETEDAEGVEERQSDGVGGGVGRRGGWVGGGARERAMAARGRGWGVMGKGGGEGGEEERERAEQSEDRETERKERRPSVGGGLTDVGLTTR